MLASGFMHRCPPGLILLLVLLFFACGGESLGRLADYNITWDSPSKDFNGSMPLGNGDIGLNVWMEANGDLLFYISKTDSWGDNGRLLKVGKVRVRLSPNPLVSSVAFRQRLVLEKGEIVIEIADKTGVSTEPAKTVLHIWVDANNPVIHVAASGRKPFSATAHIELWRTAPYELPSLEVSDVNLDRSKPNQKHAPTIVEPDTVLRNQAARIGWFHYNRKSVGPEMTMGIQGLAGYKLPDPLLHRTFGAIITATNAVRSDDLTLTTTRGTSQRFDIYVFTEHPSSPRQWLKKVDSKIRAIRRVPFAQRRQEHLRWWHDFWNRSWIMARGNDKAKVVLLKPNEHPVRIGISQTNGERFQGRIARASIFNTALSEADIAKLAGDDRQALKQQPNLTGCWTDVTPGKTLETLQKVDRYGALTLEAWIKPDQLPSGGARILDKTTPGGTDGFLLDTWPGNSLRLITEAAILSKKNILTPRQWHHVAATIDNATGRLKLFCDGKKVAEQVVAAGDEAFIVSRAYALQRFIDACAGRGAYPIKFNGSIFTVPHSGSPGDADYRRWGPGYWWQNTRLPYYSMCMSGDFDLMQPLFRMYGEDIFELSKYRTRRYFGFEGVYFPECMYFWGAVFSESYGWQPCATRKDKLQVSGYHKWEWVSGPELVGLMLDYYDYTQDMSFLQEKILPVAKEVMLFFLNYYPTTPDGKLLMHPAQALETWWDCTDPLPEIAGLRAMTRRLLTLPEGVLAGPELTFWQTARKKLPDIPTMEKDGVRMLAPARKFARKHNIENPELYAVFPFRQIALGKPNLDLGLEALKYRLDKGNSGWRQDDIFMAYLGLTDQAREYLTGRARKWHKGSRFPAFWGPNYDWIPDQDHGSVLMKAFQSMLLQTDGRRILLLPAWPQQWDVEFKLHAPYKTIVQGAFRGGQIVDLRVFPERRRKDIVIMKD